MSSRYSGASALQSAISNGNTTENATRPTKRAIGMLIEKYGLDEAMLIVWDVYFLNHSNIIKQKILKALTDFKSDDIIRFSMALVSEQLKSNDAKMINNALDYIDAKPTYEAFLLLKNVDGVDFQTHQRIINTLRRLEDLVLCQSE